MKKDNRSALTRRDFFKGGAILGAAAVGASILSSCSPQTSGGDTDTDTSNSNDAESTSSSYDYSNLKSKSVAGEASQYDFKHINQPLTLGKYELKNRMIKSCSSGFEFRGSSEVQAEVYRQYAQGGAAMIVYPVMQVMTSAADTASLIPIIEAVHETEGVPFFAQVVGEGSERGGEFDLHAPLGAPIFKVGDTAMMSEGEDAEMMPMMESGPNTMMTTEQVQIKVEAFAQSANFLKAAGFDGIEINAAAEHFFDSFLSRFWNRERTDQYGPQSIENRCRILTEIITRIHELCGEDFPVGVLYNGHECNALYPGDDNLCSTVSETREMAKVFEAAGASHLQIRSVMFGNHTSGFFPDLHFTNGEPDTTYGHFYDIKRYWPEYIAEYGGAGAFLDTAAKIKEVVSIPVFPVAMQDPRLLPDIIDNAIGEGKIDAIAMTRRIYADLEFPNKIVVGDLSNIRPCTNCTHCLQGACRVNPAFGRGLGEEMPEGYTPAPTASPKKILIVGGGPAGLECAHTAAERGHSVTLYEKSSVWGGLTNTAIAIKGTHEKIKDHIDWLVRQCESAGVTMNLNTEVTADTVAADAPDVMIAATGGIRALPSIPGVDNPVVASGYIPEDDADTIVVVGGLECEGVQVAAYLAKQGKQVTLIDELPEDRFGWIMPDWIGPTQKYYCQTHGVRILAGVKYGSITDDGITVTLSHDNIEETIECDNIVLALPVSPDSSLLDEIKDSVTETYAIGDCNEHGLIREAVLSGNLLARKL